jgi:allophanate hydrolase
VLSLELPKLREAYRRRSTSPVEVVSEVFARIEAAGDDAVWINRVSRDEAFLRAEQLQALPEAEKARLPLHGLPFGVKDCIDVAGIPTTCACPEFSYVPERSASSVEKLIAAGAIFIGKTNLDQFATGLVGTRSPYGTPRNPFNADYLPGGSSSGSAVAVAAGLVSFALGTDTGGSGRVPACYTNTVGLKPTVGKVSPRGLVNACRTIDCITVYALSGAQAMEVLDVIAGYEPATPFSRLLPAPGEARLAHDGQPFTIAVPDDGYLEFFGDPDTPGLFAAALAVMERLGARIRRIDYTPFLEVNRMMFFGPLLAERYASVGGFLEANPEAGDPVVRRLIADSKSLTAAETFRMLYRLEEIRRQLSPMWEAADLMMVPTVGRLNRKADIAADPLGPNFNHGYYTNFVNPLDLAAVATPAGFVRDGMPAGVTLIGPAHGEAFLASLADTFSSLRVERRGAI